MKPIVYPFTAESEFHTDERCYIIEMVNTDDDPALSIARARVEPGVSTCWHRLRGISERYVILQGRGRVELGDDFSRTVGPGDAVMIPPLCRQRICNKGAEDLVFLAICSPRFVPQAYEGLEEA